jgi:hypothetical protein
MQRDLLSTDVVYRQVECDDEMYKNERKPFFKWVDDNVLQSIC